jgi:hypothetical protein
MARSEPRTVCAIHASAVQIPDTLPSRIPKSHRNSKQLHMLSLHQHKSVPAIPYRPDYWVLSASPVFPASDESHAATSSHRVSDNGESVLDQVLLAADQEIFAGNSQANQRIFLIDNAHAWHLFNCTHGCASGWRGQGGCVTPANFGAGSCVW